MVHLRLLLLLLLLNSRLQGLTVHALLLLLLLLLLLVVLGHRGLHGGVVVLGLLVVVRQRHGPETAGRTARQGRGTVDQGVERAVGRHAARVVGQRRDALVRVRRYLTVESSTLEIALHQHVFFPLPVQFDRLFEQTGVTANKRPPPNLGETPSSGEPEDRFPQITKTKKNRILVFTRQANTVVPH